MKWGLMAAAAALMTLAATSAASAAVPCQERTTILAKLANDYAEAPVAIGMASNGGVLEVLAATAERQTFTIIVTMPNGMSCMVASGQNFEMLEQVKATVGDPA